MFIELELEIEEPMPKYKDEDDECNNDDNRGVCVIDLNGNNIFIIEDVLESK